MKTKVYTLFLFSIASIFSGCEKEVGKLKTDEHMPIPVVLGTTTQDTSQKYYNSSGITEAVNSANLSTRTMGYIKNIHVQVGDIIKKGQLLINIHNADLAAKLAQAEAGIAEATASYERAEKDFQRFTQLFRDTSASQIELDDVTVQYLMAKARLESATQIKNELNAQFSYTNIKAPFNGKVTNKFVHIGDMANPGMPLIEVESSGLFQVLTRVPESRIFLITNDMEVEVNIKSLNEHVKGKVIEVSTSAKNTGGQYQVKVALESTDFKLRSGMFVNVKFPVAIDAPSQTVYLPKKAIVTHGQLSGVYSVSQSNTALLRWLRLGKTNGDKVEVLSGLSIGEKYILSAEKKLYNGAKISIQ